MSITHKNHYVPIWYQKRFLTENKNTLFHLDLYPEKKKLENGHVITMNELHVWGPSNCFLVPDLYTTTFFGIQSDEIEKFLFGPIDQTGSRALVAIVNQDVAKLHYLFTKFFEYMDAQKLRTPKGLDWIKSHYPTLSHTELMLEMQRLRQMHGTMWVEAVREIVSAENATVKFIVSDHPVTIFNHAADPNTDLCKYPGDPSIALKGSQTIFPLDLNHCLILTNLEYAKNPERTDPLSNRTHARFYGQTITKIDNMIRTRKLTDQEVTAINYVLKSRAHSCIAAAKKEWLYPEKSFSDSWHNIRNILIPPKNELWKFGGEIFVGNKDGSVHYQDAFGRTTRHSKKLHKIVKKNVGVNDPCLCGSGKKYKKCCKDKPISQRPSFEEYSIRERNLILIHEVADILHLDQGKTWEDIRRELNNNQVSDIYKTIGTLWSPETDLMELLPHPDPKVIRALYTGHVDPRVIPRNVVGFSLYVDEILVLSPFVNPRCVKEEFSPITHPQEFKEQTLKDIFLLFQLAPFIDAGIVNLIPDPCDFDYHLRKDIWSMAERRYQHRHLDEELENESFSALFKEDFARNLFGLPDQSIKHQIKKAIPDIKEDLLEDTLVYIKKMRLMDPLALLQPKEPGEKNSQYIISRFGPNLELNFFIAQVTGSFVYTDSPLRWKEILSAYDPSTPIITEDIEKILSTNFTFLDHINAEIALKLRQAPKLGEYRKQFRELWKKTLLQSNEEIFPGDKTQLCKKLKIAHDFVEDSWPSVKDKLEKEIKNPVELSNLTVGAELTWAIPNKGFGINNVYRLLLAHSRRTDYLKSLPMAVFVRFKEDNL